MTNPEKRTLLVVDDEEPNRDMLARRLRRQGYTVLTASGGEEALHLIGKDGIELVLLDNMMPGLSGLEVLRSVRGTRSPAELPVIMITAQTGSENVVRALQEGANDYITKPVDFAVALARIRTQLSRLESEKALRASQQRYALASLASGDGLWDWDLIADTIYYSARWKEILGYGDGEIGASVGEWLDRVHPADLEQVRATLAAHRDGATPRYECEHRIRRKDGSYIWVMNRGLAVRDGRGAAFRIAGAMIDVTESKLADPLTGLPNRLFLTQRLDLLLQRAGSASGGATGLILLDLDGFKLVNDSLGHAVGDRLLVEVAARLRSAVRSEERAGTDVAARLGGDEFAVVLQNIRRVSDVAHVAERLQERFRHPITVDRRPVFVSFSMGIVAGGPEHATAEDLLRDADTAMYHAKANGKRRYEVFDSRMRARAVARMELDLDLRIAIDSGQFVLFYQPKISLGRRRIVGFEALLRWAHPKRGLIPPGEFIPVAEESGLIVPIGLWALREACRQAAVWQAQYAWDPPVGIGVNLSGRQLAEPDLLSDVERIIAETGVIPGSLTLEITESVLLRESDQVLRTLRGLRQLNVGVDLDDFGTGYSSLGYLHRLPANALKIDRSFVARLGADEETTQIVRGILSMAGGLEMDVVAEGIETAEQAEALRTWGCKYGQGFYFSRPVPAGQAAALLASQQEVPCRVS